MPARPTLLAVLAALLAVPACKKQDGDEGGGDGGGIRYSKSDRDLLRSSQDNLKQIGLALHAFHDANGYFPNAVRGRDGKPALSWRVAILPYLDQAALYQRFKLEEPWDSETNRTLVAAMPKVYAPPGIDDYNGHTYYRAFAGEGAFLPPPPRGAGFGGGAGATFRGVRMSDVTDGTSNTIMVAEAAAPVPWTKPDELDYKANGPLPTLGGVFREGANVLFMDGSVRFLETDASARLLKPLITVGGGETIRD